MADSKPKRRIKKSETVRERVEKAEQPKKTRRVRQAATTATSGLSSVRSLGAREYHPVKLPDNKLGRFLTKRRHFIPRFFRESWQELRLVTWPNRKETTKLTLAVVIFAVVFGSLVWAVDYGLDKLFKGFLLD